MSSNLDPHRWEEIQAAFDELVELDAESQAVRLIALGDGDPGLRAAVEALLAADAEASTRLAQLDFALATASEPGPDPLHLAGRTVTHFLVKEALGVGGMGVVYRGEDMRLGRAVALKFLLPHYTLDASAKTRFLREARAAAALDHPQLCTIHDVGETEDGRLFLAMALYGGETLKARLAREGPFPVSDAVAIARQIVRGLGCAHAAGIVHRDLKPGNVMVLPDGTVKILDFGLAKALDDTTSVTSAGFGTVAYMAPEQIQGAAVDARTDLWALGVVLYEMLTAKKPFMGEQEVGIAHAIVHAEPVAPSVLREGVPDVVEEIVLGLLQKEPSARYAGAEELLAHLTRLGTAEGPGLRAPLRPVRTKHRRISAWQWVASLGVALVIGGLGGTAITTWLESGPLPPTAYGIPLTDAEGLASVLVNDRIAISPDGDRLVYVGRSPNGETQLWMRARDQLHSTPLAGTEGGVNPFFSPDGSRLGFFAARAGKPAVIKVVSLAGGTPTTVTDSAVDWGGGSWGHDGYIYFDSRLKGDGIARVRENGGIPEAVTETDPARGEAWQFQPEPLPNHKGVLFDISRGGDESDYDIGIVDLRTRVHRVLLHGLAPHYSASGHLLYATADGTLMAAPFDQDKMAVTGPPIALAEGLHRGVDGGIDLTSSATGRLVYAAGPSAKQSMQLVWVTREGKETAVDTTWRASFSSLALSPDGTRLAVAIKERGRINIWVKRLDHGPVSEVMSEGDLNNGPGWTHDGRAVTFLSNTRSHSKVQLDVYRSLADGSSPAQPLRHEVESISEADYSRDGKWLVYRAGWNLVAVRTQGDTTPIPLVTTTQFRPATPRLSPNGRWLAYSSNETGQREVYVRPFPKTGTTKWQVSPAGGYGPVWSRDGRELFYRNTRDEMVAARVLPGATFTLREQQPLLSVERYQTNWSLRDYDVSPDAKRFIVIRSPEKTRDELIVIDNFVEALKAKVKR